MIKKPMISGDTSVILTIMLTVDINTTKYTIDHITFPINGPKIDLGISASTKRKNRKDNNNKRTVATLARHYKQESHH